MHRIRSPPPFTRNRVETCGVATIAASAATEEGASPSQFLRSRHHAAIARTMRMHPVTSPYRLLSAAICCCTILSGCVNSSTAPAPEKVVITPALPPVPQVSDATARETLRNISGAQLSPAQVENRNVGKRIRWAGAVQRIAPADKGVCLTILYAPSGEHGEPLWTNDPTNQIFNACTARSYDSALVEAFTNVTIVGRISGKASIGMGGGGVTVPTVEIEKLFRWSDCLEGDTASICKIGFLSPTVPSGE
jgi:hypothetical protein